MKNKLIVLAMLGIFSANFMHSDEVEEVVHPLVVEGPVQLHNRTVRLISFTHERNFGEDAAR